MERLVDRTIGATLFTKDANDPLPPRARTVVVGGGIIGASTAYHLAEAGDNDVILLESNVLGSGTTWHAAGLVSAGRSSATLTKLAKYGIEMYSTLEDRSGIDVSFQQSGSLMLARTPGRMDEIQYLCDIARQQGVKAEVLDAAGVGQLWPIARTEGILGGLYLPEDGHVNPGYAAVAFAKLADGLGVGIRENVSVSRILQSDDKVTGVLTDRGTIDCDRVILACGLWTRDLAATVGVHVPLYAAEHVHVRAGKVEGAVPGLPVLRDLDHSYYIRHELGGLLVGAFEPDGLPRPVKEISAGGFAEFPADWDHFAPIRSHAEAAVPALVEAGYDRFLNAPESFTPDSNFILGEAAEVGNLFVAAGFNSQGIIFGPGAGKELARWVIEGTAGFDASSVDVQRFSRHQSNRTYLHERTREGLGRLYAMHWPQLQPVTARNVRRSPLHSRLAEMGAGFGELNGWERANWYGTPGTEPSYEYSFGRQNWFEQVGEEHKATREGVVLFDLSGFAKFEVAGPAALEVCQQACTANVDLPVNKSTYGLFLNENGGIELDGTVTRLAADRFMVITPAASQDKTLWHLTRLAKGKAAAVFDATAGLATIGVMGPRSRELLSRISPEDWSDDAQKYTEGRTVEVADGFAYCLRVSFVGELGYELYPSADTAINVFDALWEAGQDLGIRMAGYYALDSLRSEKGFRHLGHDIGPADNPYSASLGFTLALEKPGGFVGREAVLGMQAAGQEIRAVYVALEDPEPVLVHDETVFRDGVAVGRMTSGSYGYTLGRAVGLASVKADIDFSGEFTVECKGKLYPATVSRRPFYDPNGERLRG
ncbi:FAD-dependent oxidoreductase [Pseudarthrobacter sp. AL07]|uniref:GcvT family protein n=1 Tax=unclassified Pseudarthrobacter TaxID=2647000 RepID=UPI002499D626|nr:MULTISPECIES: FAD-dependent oxidoreductase [unclassified Pseudarthrobacter]MDI3196010.1 FAD-dependent oxidoreductase [Pseudarthrobacter sp. AL20]MDI3210097.1 FAD-dependent oxidoreductase [Pseudarthrobacter sp. AL07]